MDGGVVGVCVATSLLAPGADTTVALDASGATAARFLTATRSTLDVDESDDDGGESAVCAAAMADFEVFQ